MSAEPEISERETPPPPGPPRHAAFPETGERILANGLRVVAFRPRTGPKALGVPLIAAQLIVRGGGASEAEPEAGLAALTAALMTAGTTARGAREIAQLVDALGARLDASSGYDASVVSVSALTPVFEQAFALFEEIVRRPAFAAAEVERVRAKSIGDLALTYSNPTALARLVAARVAYGAGPYGHPLAGTAATLAALTRDDVVRFHERWYRPDNAVLVLGGDIALDAAFALAERVFGSWHAPAAPLAARAAFAALPSTPRVVAIDKPAAGRTALIAGRVAIDRRASEYAAGIVATSVLSGYSGRLNQAIRVKRGLSYGAGAQLVARRDPGLFVAATLVDHTKAVEATKVVRETLAGLGTAAVAEAELRPRKASVTGGFYRGIETIDGIAGTLGELALYDLPLSDMERFVATIEAIGPLDVQRYARAYIAHDTFAVLVGDAGVFGAELAAAYPGATVVPYADLDLGRPAIPS